ncbi:MAG: RidA family protein [Actinomycetia bacterium]|nr:RidA family protein [Actinomycetes bacterium]
MHLVDHPDGGYAYVPGISPYSAGVVAAAGHRIRHVNLRRATSWQDGFELIDETLAADGRPSRSLCSIELRCPEPYSFGGFGSFNDDYRTALDSRGILLADGVNPVARTNVAPLIRPPARTLLHAFAFTVPEPNGSRPSFVVSGAGDLRDQADLRAEAIVGGTSSWADSGTERATAVLDEIQARLSGLGLGWADTDSVSVYSVESIHPVLEPTVLARLGDASRRGVHWYLAAPPVAGLRFEMDARGGVEEVWV